MKNYDAIMQSMTPERMAEVNVKLVTVNNTNLFYMTSSGQLFNTNQYDDAVRYEYRWLMTDPTPETESVTAKQACECEECGEPDTCDCERDCSTHEVAN